ncbi:MAG: sulfatase, partial [Chloroflexota bacterium]|nr:sulfatase [Chloroflexota bacterium]
MATDRVIGQAGGSAADQDAGRNEEEGRGVRPRATRWTGRLTVLALLVLALPVLSAVAPPAGAVAVPSARPNIVLILLDDLDARSVEAMPNVMSLLRDQGTTFENFFVTTPLCCPSRASILRGQYAHNHGVLRNVKKGRKPGGFPTFLELGREGSTVATWLHDAGYRTALVGKYLNQYPEGAEPGHVPPGWDEWSAEARGQYFNYRLNENGTVVRYGRDPGDYQTDVLAAKATDFVARSAVDDRPFFLYLAPHAPHTPATPAPRHAEAFAGATAPRAPSFNEADVGDKPGWVRAAPALSADEIAGIDELHRQRSRSLLAVDDMVAALVDALRAGGALDDTYVLLTSDNGFHQGEHRLPGGKGDPYEASIRVPLLVRGPGVAAGGTVGELALNVDLAPTLAELAGATAPGFVDGRSLVPLLAGEPPPAWRRALLVELFGGEGRV